MADKGEDNKRIIGLYGEMCLAMELHKQGWQVYRAYIDEHVDFIVARYYCTNCNKFASVERRQKEEKDKKTKEYVKKNTTFPTDLCSNCQNKSLKFITRFIQAKTSEGIEMNNGIRQYSFHAKLRSNIDERSFYVWIAIINNNGRATPHFYIFNHTEIDRFDNLSLASYQKTDNQKLNLNIDSEGKVTNKGKIHDYSCFNDDFHNEFEKLDEIYPSDAVKK